MADSDLTYRAATLPLPAMIPADYAEKAMGSLMQLHSELMDEKERRVDLYRRLMDREQAVAELRMYVKILEDRLGLKEQSPPPSAEAPPQDKTVAPSHPSIPLHASIPSDPRRRSPSVPLGTYRTSSPRKEVMAGWKVW